METQKISFTGYDARPLKGILARDSGFGKLFFQFITRNCRNTAK